MASSTERERTALPWRSRLFQVVLASTFVLPLGVPLLSPILPAVRDAFGITDVRTSYLLSVYFLPGIVLSPIIGRSSDRVGRRPVLVVSLFAFGVVGIAIASLEDFTLILAARFVQGVAAAGIFVTTVTIIAESFAGAQRNAVFGFNVAMLSTGRSLYPVLGGALAAYGWRAPFLCFFVAVLVGLFVARRFDESPRTPRSDGSATVRDTVTELIDVRTPPLYAATVLAEVVIFGAIMTAVPFLLATDFDGSGVVIGSIVALTTAVSALVAAANGRLARRFSNRDLVGTGFVLFGTSMLGVGTAASTSAIAILVVPFGAGIGLVLPSVDAGISRVVSSGMYASALSLRQSATGLGRATGPLLFTALASVTGYRALLLGAGSATLTIGLGGLTVIRLRQHTTRAE